MSEASGSASGSTSGTASGTASSAAAGAPADDHALWRTAFVEGVALWAPTMPGWLHAQAALAANEATGLPAPAASQDAMPPVRPAPRSLAANERRRAPDSVLAALQAAEEAVAMSGRSAATLASVFTSAHGDLPILDAMLRTLATEPQLLSPMRFHHSVHNAPSGYWAIAAGSHAASTALAAFEGSAGAGLLEALVQVAAEREPVLVVGCDTGASGPLASVNASRGLLAWALVLAPEPGPGTRFALPWRTASHGTAALPERGPPPLRHNAQAPVLPLFEALARRRDGERLLLNCGATLTLELRPRPQGPAGQGAGPSPGA